MLWVVCCLGAPGLRPSAATRIDVTVHRSGRRSREGLRVHRPRSLHRGEVTTHHGIPVSTPARTILDLAATLGRRPLERLFDQAENTRLTHIASLEALARAHAGHHAAGRLLAALTMHMPGTTITKSELEERFLGLCDEAGLPRPRVNDWIAHLEVDFHVAGRRLLVETDGWRHHNTREAFERDRRRDAIFVAAGYRVLRFTDRQLTSDAATVVAALRASLGDLPAARAHDAPRVAPSAWASSPT